VPSPVLALQAQTIRWPENARRFPRRSHGFALPVVAEGLQTEAKLAFLVAGSLQRGPGFLIGRPYPIDSHAELIGRPARVRRGRCSPGRMTASTLGARRPTSLDEFPIFGPGKASRLAAASPLAQGEIPKNAAILVASSANLQLPLLAPT
jgi:hypothetical protein